MRKNGQDNSLSAYIARKETSISLVAPSLVKSYPFAIIPSMAQKIDSEQVKQSKELTTINNPLVAASKQSPEDSQVVSGDSGESVGGQAETPTPNPTTEVTNVKDVPIEDAIHAKLKGVTEFNIVVVGCFSMGKSTLINALFFEKDKEYEEKAEEGSLAPCTMRESAKEPYILEINGIKYNIYDSPGLQDGEEDDLELLQWISQRHDKIHLVIYCTRMGDPVRPSEIEAMKNITTAFTKSIWNNAVIALTFANQVDSPNPKIKEEEYFEKVMKNKVESLNNTFTKLSFKKETLNKITKNVYPAGSATKLLLPGKSQDWRVDFWRGCLDACDPKGKKALFELAKSKSYIKLALGGGSASTASGIAAIAAGLGCVVAGAVLTGTGFLAPVGIPLIIGGGVSTGLGAAAASGGGGVLYATSQVKKEEEKRKKNFDARMTKKQKNKES